MAPLFSKVDLNKLWHDVQDEETLIYAKFGKDLFNISKVIGRKMWHSFFWLTVYNWKNNTAKKLTMIIAYPIQACPIYDYEQRECRNNNT